MFCDMIGINNPFNIRFKSFNKWLGQVGHTRGFCDFSSFDYGVRAACILIMRSYRKKDVLTISEIVNRFAPSSENDTGKYIDFLCSRMGCFPFDIPRCSDFPKLLSLMSKYEGNPVSSDYIADVIKLFHIVPYNKC